MKFIYAFSGHHIGVSYGIGLEQRRRGKGTVSLEWVALRLFTVSTRSSAVSARELRQSYDETAEDRAGEHQSPIASGGR